MSGKLRKTGNFCKQGSRKEIEEKTVFFQFEPKQMKKRRKKKQPKQIKESERGRRRFYPFITVFKPQF